MSASHRFPVFEDALERMERRARNFSDGILTDNETAHQLVMHVLTLAGEVRRRRDLLKRYGKHLPFCGKGHCNANPCTCGLDRETEQE